MDLMEAIRARHSVRQYTRKPIVGEKAEILQDAVRSLSAESGVGIHLVLNEPLAFASRLAKYGKFKGCANYFVFTSGKDQDEAVGYYGEKLVLLAQQLGLNTCWVGATYGKKKVPVTCGPGEKIRIVIALGYGENQGDAHKNKKLESLYTVPGEAPDWFLAGMEAVLLAPTAVNQQKFHFTLGEDGTVTAEAPRGPFTKVDLGIAKLHFEVGAGTENFRWAD